jgi:uncharacterized membrane protein YgcG
MPLDPVSPSQLKKQRKTGLGATAIGLGIFGLAAFSGVAYVAFSGGSYSVSDLRNPRATQSYVIDRSGVLQPVANDINKVGAQLREKTGVRMVVVTVPKTKVDPQMFASEAQSRWTQGQGVVVLLTTQGKKLRFATGERAKSQGLTNARMQEIVDNTMIPELRKGNITAATLAGVREMASSVGAPSAAASLPTTYYTRAYYPRYYYVGGWSMGASALYILLIFGTIFVLGSLGWGTMYTFGWGWYGPAYGWYGPGMVVGGPGVYVDGGVGYDVGGYDGGGVSDCGGGDW